MLWVQIDSDISATTMPEPQRFWTVHIGCNDCRCETEDALFHYYGMKCGNNSCGSYNTYVITLDKHGHEEEVPTGMEAENDLPELEDEYEQEEEEEEEEESDEENINT